MIPPVARPERVGPDALQYLLASMAEFALGSRHPAFWSKFLDAESGEPMLPRDSIQPTPTAVLDTEAALADAIGHEGIARELWAFAAGLPVPARTALDALLRRRLDPFEALATWPLENLFEDDECRELRRPRRPEDGVQPRRLRLVPGGDLDYGGHMAVIAKFTRLCNLRCTYCHDWRSGPGQRMPFLVQARLFRAALDDPRHGTVEVIWHGGEATLLGRREFLRILAQQRWFQRPRQRVRNRLQTNATTIDAEWIRFLARYGFRVSTSIDGPPDLHDRTRLRVDGGGSFAAVRRGLGLLREAGLLEDVYVVTTPAIVAVGAARLLQFLQEEQIARVGLLPVRPGSTEVAEAAGDDSRYLPPAAFAQFLIDLHAARRARPSPWVEIRELDAALRAVRRQMPGFCEVLGNCVGNVFSIDPDGGVAHCDKYVGDPEYTLGNIVEQDFGQIRAGHVLRRIIEQDAPGRTTQEQTCPYFTYCRGWCPHERYLRTRVPGLEPSGCCGLDVLFSSLARDVDDG